MKIKIIFLLCFFCVQCVDAVFDDHVNGKIKNRIGQIIEVGRHNENYRANQMLKLYDRLQNTISTHNVVGLWDNQKTRELIQIIIQQTQRDGVFQSLQQEAIQKTIEMQKSWNTANRALFQIMTQCLSSRSSIQFPRHDSATLDEYLKKLFTLNKDTSDENYEAVIAGTLVLFKTLQDQRNALTNENPDIL